MPIALRIVFAILTGAVAAIAVVLASDSLVHAIWPLPPGVDVRDPAQIRTAMEAMPTMAFVVLVAGWALATFVGSLVATAIALRRRLVGIVVTGLLLAATITNLSALPHPSWIWPVAVLSLVAAGWAGSRAAGARKTVAAAPA